MPARHRSHTPPHSAYPNINPLCKVPSLCRILLRISEFMPARHSSHTLRRSRGSRRCCRISRRSSCPPCTRTCTPIFFFLRFFFFLFFSHFPPLILSPVHSKLHTLSPPVCVIYLFIYLSGYGWHTPCALSTFFVSLLLYLKSPFFTLPIYLSIYLRHTPCALSTYLSLCISLFKIDFQ